MRKTTPEQRADLDLSSWSLAFNGAEPVRAEIYSHYLREIRKWDRDVPVWIKVAVDLGVRLD